jgi:hypothetical protein
MVVDAILEAVFGGFTWFLALMPDYSSSALTDGSSALSMVVSGVSVMSVWFNLPAVFGVFGLWVTIEGATWIARGVEWFYSKIPFKSS